MKVNELNPLEFIAGGGETGALIRNTDWAQTPLGDPASSFEFMNPFESWGHVRTTSYEKPEKLPSGEYYQVARLTAMARP